MIKPVVAAATPAPKPAAAFPGAGGAGVQAQAATASPVLALSKTNGIDAVRTKDAAGTKQIPTEYDDVMLTLMAYDRV